MEPLAWMDRRNARSRAARSTGETGMDTPMKRECLKRGKRFTSLGSGNRICPKCNAANAGVYQPKSAPNPSGLNSFGEPTGFETRKVGDT